MVGVVMGLLQIDKQRHTGVVCGPGLLPGFGEESRLDGLLFLRAIAVQPRERVNEVIGRVMDYTLAQEESFIDSRAKDGPVLTQAVAVAKTSGYTIPAGHCLCVCPAGEKISAVLR